MRTIIFLIFMLLCTFLYGQEQKSRNTILTTSLTEVWFKYDSQDAYEMGPRPCINIDGYPLNWLSVGAFYSWDLDEGSKSKIRYRTSGGNVGLHIYPLFNWLQLEYLKNNLDIYLQGIVQQDFYEYNSKLEDFNFIQKHTEFGYGFGLSYFPIKHVGVTLRYKKIGDKYSPIKYIKGGIIFRL